MPSWESPTYTLVYAGTRKYRKEHKAELIKCDFKKPGIDYSPKRCDLNCLELGVGRREILNEDGVF